MNFCYPYLFTEFSGPYIYFFLRRRLFDVLVILGPKDATSIARTIDRSFSSLRLLKMCFEINNFMFHLSRKLEFNHFF